MAGVRTARKRLRLEIGKFSATEEATIDQRYKEEVYSGKCVHNRMERVEWGCVWAHLLFLQRNIFEDYILSKYSLHKCSLKRKELRKEGVSSCALGGCSEEGGG